METMDAFDLLGVIEACYDLNGDVSAWLARVTEAIGGLLDNGLGVMSNLYAGTSPSDTRITDIAFAYGFPVDRIDAFRHEVGVHAPTVGSQPMSFEHWYGLACGHIHAIEGLEAITAAMPVLGGQDLYAINARDANGFGIWVGAPLKKCGKVDARADRLWARVATHLVSGYRLRRALARDDAPSEARLSPDGTVHDLEAGIDGREAAELRRVVVAVDRARGKEARADAEQATSVWTGLVRARWSLVDEFTASGQRYVVAKKNELETTSAALTPREQMVLGLASIGRSNKEIAYELGLSSSTVRVLLARAAQRLGVKHRDEAVARYRALNA